MPSGVLLPAPEGLHRGKSEQRPQRIHETMVELHQIVAFVEESLHEGEDLAVLPAGQEVHVLQITLALHQAEHPPHGLMGDLPTGQRDDLVQEREGVPHPPVGLMGYGPKRIVGRCESFTLEHDREA